MCSNMYIHSVDVILISPPKQKINTHRAINISSASMLRRWHFSLTWLFLNLCFNTVNKGAVSEAHRAAVTDLSAEQTTTLSSSWEDGLQQMETMNWSLLFGDLLQFSPSALFFLPMHVLIITNVDAWALNLVIWRPFISFEGSSKPTDIQSHYFGTVIRCFHLWPEPHITQCMTSAV